MSNRSVFGNKILLKDALRAPPLQKKFNEKNKKVTYFFTLK